MRNLKASLRSQVREKLKTLSLTRRRADSSLARRILEQQPIWKKSHTILFFAPLPDEPDLWPSLTVALNAGKQVFLPRFESRNNSYSACQINSPAIGRA